jgi:hypothetical protein
VYLQEKSFFAMRSQVCGGFALEYLTGDDHQIYDQQKSVNID